MPIFPDLLVPNVNWSSCNFAALVHYYLLQKHYIFDTAGKSCISAIHGKKLLYLNLHFLANFLSQKVKNSYYTVSTRNNKPHFAYISGKIAKFLTELRSAR